MSDCYQTLLENNKMLMESNAMLNNKILKLLKKNKLLEYQVIELNLINQNYREIQLNNSSKLQNYKEENKKLQEKCNTISKIISDNLNPKHNNNQQLFGNINMIPYPIQINMPYQIPNQNNYQYDSNPQQINSNQNITNVTSSKNISDTNKNKPPPLPVTPLPSFPNYKNTENKKKGKKNTSGNITMELKHALKNHRDSSAANILKSIKKMKKGK